MQKCSTAKLVRILATGLVLTLTFPAIAPSAAMAASDKAHQHTEKEKDIHQGYFEDSQIEPRQLSDWEGKWQSVFPYLQDGTLDPVLEMKATKSDKSLEEYRAYYAAGYETEVDHIEITDNRVSFQQDGQSITADYAQDGYEILTYEKGNRGVRYVFRKSAGDDAAPEFIQFSDHAIAPVKAGHYHLYWGNDRAALLKELKNWPTYYPASLSGDDIVHEMLAH